MKKKIHFIQGWGTYPNETLVIIGHNADEITKVMRLEGCLPDAIKVWEKDIDEHREFLSQDNFKGCVIVDKKNRSILWLRDWTASWDNYDTLVHEISHLVFALLGERKMLTETEAIAYQTEYLFREIRRHLGRLSGSMKKKPRVKKKRT